MTWLHRHTKIPMLICGNLCYLTITEMEMWNFRHWLQRLVPMSTISSKRRHLHFSDVTKCWLHNILAVAITRVRYKAKRAEQSTKNQSHCWVSRGLHRIRGHFRRSFHREGPRGIFVLWAYPQQGCPTCYWCRFCWSCVDFTKFRGTRLSNLENS